MNIPATERLYRSQPKDYRNCPLVPTAMRCNNIPRLKNAYSKLIKEYSDFNIEATTKWYKEIRYTRGINPFEGYFLSLVHLCITIKRNPILKVFCEVPFFTDAKHNVGTLNCDDATTVKRCYNYAKALFKRPEKQDASALYHDIVKNEMSYFQHLNHVFNKVCEFCQFPTMMLDWSDKQEIVETFYKNKEKDIFSIDKEKCFDFFRSDLIQIHINPNSHAPKNVEPIMYGLYHYEMKDCKNQLMIDQCGTTIFWPWSFTPCELIEQNKDHKGLGYILDFKLENEAKME